MYTTTSDDRAATPGASEFFRAYFTAKSAKDQAAFLSHYAEHAVHGDATTFALMDRQTLEDIISQYMPNWGEGGSYSTEIFGDENSAVVLLADTPELFGSEVRAAAAVDMADGKIVRFIDYWDGRAFGSDLLAAMRFPRDNYPPEQGEHIIGERADPRIRDVASRLSAALSAGDPVAASALFHPDATWEDIPLRTKIRGRYGIEGYLQRAISALPFGAGSALRHTLGSATAGGYEWTAQDRPVPHGVNALVLGPDGAITSLISMWDSALLPIDDVITLAGHSINR